LEELEIGVVDLAHHDPVALAPHDKLHTAVQHLRSVRFVPADDSVVAVIAHHALVQSFRALDIPPGFVSMQLMRLVQVRIVQISVEEFRYYMPFDERTILQTQVTEAHICDRKRATRSELDTDQYRKVGIATGTPSTKLSA
jgi:hypothetical protein